MLFDDVAERLCGPGIDTEVRETWRVVVAGCCLATLCLAWLVSMPRDRAPEPDPTALCLETHAHRRIHGRLEAIEGQGSDTVVVLSRPSPRQIGARTTQRIPAREIRWASLAGEPHRFPGQPED